MKRYWDYTERERAAMTREQVEQFFDYELMERGVLKVPPLILQDLKPEPDLKRTTWFQVGSVLFNTIEKAEAYMKLEPHTSGYNYAVGYDKEYAEPVDKEIKQVQKFDREEMANAATVLSANKAIKEANRKDEQAHAKATEEQGRVLDGLTSDWMECQDRDRQHKRVIDTRLNYLQLANGDDVIAENFLRKLFPVAVIEEADKWFGIEPSTVPVEAVPDALAAKAEPAKVAAMKSDEIDF